MTWVPDSVYGARAVPLGEAPARPPQTSPLIYMPGGPQDPGMNVIPFPSQRMQSCKIVRQGMDKDGRPVDPYADLLDKIPDMRHVPGVNDHLFRELIPSPEDEKQIHMATPVNPKVTVSSDPREDAYVGSDAASGRVPNLSG